MDRILEFWIDKAAAVYSTFCLIVLWLSGLGLGVLLGTMYGLIFLKPYLHNLTVYDLGFWCPYRLATASNIDQLVWTLCAFSGLLKPMEITWNLLFPPNATKVVI